MNYIIVGSLSMSVLGLLMIYISASNAEIENIQIDEISPDLVGRTVSVEGYIEQKRNHENGHIFLTVGKNGHSVQVPVFRNVAQHMESRKFYRGSRVQVTGLVDEYRGTLQIIPRKPSDLILT